LRIFQYDVSAAIAWKTADVEAGGGHWGAMNVQQTALINSLEEALTKKGAVIDELQKAEEKSDRVLSQAGRDLEQSEQDVKDTTDHLQRSRKRITILEEELTQQFEDLQKQSTRQRGRIAVLESELESTIALSTGTKNRQEQQIAALSQKVTRLEDAETMQQSKHDDKFDELRIEIIGARTEAADAAELRKEVAVLKAKLLDQQAVQITAENKSAEAVALRKQITKAAAEMESTAEEHRTAARATAKELETTKLALEQLKGSTETTIAQLRAELGEKSSELAASNQDGMVSMSELTLMEKEDEMKVLRGNVVNLTEKVESLKHGSAAMVGTIKYTVQDLKASKEVLQRDTRSIISGAVRLWEQLQPAVVRLIAIVNNVEIDKRELVRKYQSEVGWKHSALEMIGLSPPFKCQSLTYAWTVRLGCRTEITIQQDSRAQRQHSVLLSCPIRRSCGGGSQLHLGYRDSHSDRERWPHKVL
jgi:DNA repair exonuclease SbcCD ATPase subunit